VSWWRSGYDAGLMIKRSRVQLSFRSLSSGYYLDGWLSVDT